MKKGVELFVPKITFNPSPKIPGREDFIPAANPEINVFTYACVLVQLLAEQQKLQGDQEVVDL